MKYKSVNFRPQFLTFVQMLQQTTNTILKSEEKPLRTNISFSFALWFAVARFIYLLFCYSIMLFIKLSFFF